MLCRSFLAAVAVLLGLSSGVYAQDDELQPTTEFGITIVADQIYDAIQETQDFWSPVRQQIVTAPYIGGDDATRQQAAAFFKRVNDQLHDRMFGGDEDQALDLIDYLSTRLRVFQLYRQLRTIVADDGAFVTLKQSWDKGLREANSLDAAARPAAIDALVEQLGREMQSVSLSASQVEQAIPQWRTVGQATRRLNVTGAGAMMLGFERDAKAADSRVAELIRAVADTADWALITKPEKKLLKGSDFARAWQELEKIEGPKTAHRPAAAGK
jgi:hypothetical protein